MPCAICQTRRPRRFCPGVRGDICSLCCGSSREATIACPLSCEYLIEARRHERFTPLDFESLPNADIEVSEEFLENHATLGAFLASRVAGAALRTPGAVDLDVREALEALIQTYRTLQSGLVYESRPANTLAARICDGAREAIAEYMRLEAERHGLTTTRDGDILRTLVQLQRMERSAGNGRKLGRAFLQYMSQSQPEPGVPERPSGADSPLILP